MQMSIYSVDAHLHLLQQLWTAIRPRAESTSTLVNSNFLLAQQRALCYKGIWELTDRPPACCSSQEKHKIWAPAPKRAAGREVAHL
jgi:hypothetical protein